MRLFVLVTALAATLAFAASAGATISAAPADPNLAPTRANYQFLDPYICGGTDPQNGYQTIKLSDPRPVLFKFGWVAMQPSQMTQFFSNQHGTYSIAGADSFTDSWSTTSGEPATSTQGITWSPVTQTSVSNNGTTVKAQTSFYRAVLTFTQTGTYTVTHTLTLDKTVNDGFGANQKGSYTNSCTFTVIP